MAQGPKVFAIGLSVLAGDGVALPVAVVAAVATVVPVVIAMVGPVNVATAMATASFSGWESTWPPTCPDNPESKPMYFCLAQEACVGHQLSGHKQVPAR